jgi:anion-transporting  ArsA/GET3 family ATPase
MAHEFDMLAVLQEIRDLLKKQNELLEKQQQPQTKITVVGNKAQTAVPKGLKNNEDFTL